MAIPAVKKGIWGEKLRKIAVHAHLRSPVNHPYHMLIRGGAFYTNSSVTIAGRFCYLHFQFGTLAHRDIFSFPPGTYKSASAFRKEPVNCDQYTSGIRTADEYETKPEGWNGYESHIELTLPALSAIVLEPKEV